MKSMIKNALLGGFMVAGMGLASLVSANPNSDYWVKNKNGYHVVLGKGSAADITAILNITGNRAHVLLGAPSPDCYQNMPGGQNSVTLPIAVNGRPINAQADCVEAEENYQIVLMISFTNDADLDYVIDQFKKSQEVVYRVGDVEYAFSAMGFSRALRDLRRAND